MEENNSVNYEFQQVEEPPVQEPQPGCDPLQSAYTAQPQSAKKTGGKIVLRALEEPARQIAENAGFEGSVVIDKILSSGKKAYGFNAYTEEYVDMFEAGIIDPTKVTRSALQNASSVASVALTTEVLVADKKEENPAPAAAPNPGMGMY